MSTIQSDEAYGVQSAPPAAETDALVARVHEIGPLLRENAVIADRDRREPDSTIAALTETGAFRISTLKRFGGYEGGARMLLEVARAVGTYDPAAAWLVVINNGSVMLANRWPDTVLDRLFGDGPVLMSSILASPKSVAVRDGDGYRVTGMWPFSSNILHAEWSIGAVAVTETDGADPTPGFAIVHRDQWTVEDTWHTIGMRGTGSNTSVVTDQWIPADQVVPASRMMGPGLESDPATTFGQRLAPMPTMATTIAASSLGGAQAALDFVAEMAHKRGITASFYDRQIKSGAFVKDLGHTSMKIEGSLLQLRASADEIDRVAAGLEPMPIPVRATCRGRVGAATYELAEAMNDLVWAHGTASFAESSPLGRMWRDVNTGVRHAATASAFTLELAGDALLGIDFISAKI